MQTVHGRSIDSWCDEFPVLREVIAYRETCWFNPATRPALTALATTGLSITDDDEMYRQLALLANCEQIPMEPSALAGLAGMARVICSEPYLRQHHLSGRLQNATHIAWGTGGSMVPTDEMENYYRKGMNLLY